MAKAPDASAGDDGETEEEKPRYFPDEIFAGEYPGSHEFVSQWYGKHLVAMDEPPMFGKDQSEQEQEYRFLWLRTFHNPISIRVVIADNGGEVVTKQCDGAGGYEPGRLFINRKKVLAPEQMEKLLATISSTGFWSLPTSEKRRGLDGAEWIFEGVRGNSYHIIDRWTPKDGSIKEMGLLFLEIGGIEGEKIY